MSLSRQGLCVLVFSCRVPAGTLPGMCVCTQPRTWLWGTASSDLDQAPALALPGCSTPNKQLTFSGPQCPACAVRSLGLRSLRCCFCGSEDGDKCPQRDAPMAPVSTDVGRSGGGVISPMAVTLSGPESSRSPGESRLGSV